MQLEKLDLLEKRLSRLIERYAQMKEENQLLRNRLEQQAKRQEELEVEVEAQRGRREKAGAVLGRITGALDKLEQLQQSDAGAGQ